MRIHYSQFGWITVTTQVLNQETEEMESQEITFEATWEISGGALAQPLYLTAQNGSISAQFLDSYQKLTCCNDCTRNGPRGPAGLGIPFAVDRMQNLVEILGQPFAEMLIWIPKFKNVA